MARFKNTGGGVTVHLIGSDVRVEAGKSVSTKNDELATALRKNPDFKESQGEGPTKVSTWKREEKK